MKLLTALAAVAAALTLVSSALAAANGRIVYQSEQGAPAEYYANLFSVEPDGSAPLRLTPEYFNPGNVAFGSSPDVSPDGTRVVFAALVETGTPSFELFVANMDGSGVTRLTNTARSELKPAWSPDGTRIAYQAYVSSAGATEIFVIGAGGGDPVRVTDSAARGLSCGPTQQYAPDWLDTDTLVFESDGPSGSPSVCTRDLWIADVDGSGLAPLLVTPESWLGEFEPAVSPDGSRIVFRRHNGLLTMRSDGSDVRQITLTDADRSPAWSPDGRQIVFQSGRYVDGQPIGWQIWTMNADGSNMRPLTRSSQNFDPTWAPAPDRTPPAVTCPAPPTGWQNANVVVACTAEDGTSGLADAGDAAFELTTSVPDGTETADAVTGSREVCDTAGNCATVGPFTGIKVDRKAPGLVLTAPIASTYLLNAHVGASYSCTDGGSGVALCAAPVAAGTAVDTVSVGTKTFAVSATDGVGNTATSSVAYLVSYGVVLLYDPAKPTNRIRLQLVDATGAIVSDPSIAVTATSIDGTLLLNNGFSYVKHNDSYLLRLTTRTLDRGAHELRFRAGSDPREHRAQFLVR